MGFKFQGEQLLGKKKNDQPNPVPEDKKKRSLHDIESDLTILGKSEMNRVEGPIGNVTTKFEIRCGTGPPTNPTVIPAVFSGNPGLSFS